MPKSVSQLNPAEDPQESDLLYVGQIARTPRDRKIGIAALARAFLHRALTHPVLSWVPGGDPVRVMARKGIGDTNDQVGLLDLQTPFKDARTEIIRMVITGTPATATFDMGAHPGNVELFLTGADATPHLVLTNDIAVGHSLKIRSTGIAEAVIVEYPAGTTLYYLQPSQTMVLARDAAGYLISVEATVGLPMRTTFLGSESVKLTDIGGQWWRTTLGELASKLLALAGAVSDPVAGDEVIISRAGTQYRIPYTKLQWKPIQTVVPATGAAAMKLYGATEATSSEDVLAQLGSAYMLDEKLATIAIAVLVNLATIVSSSRIVKFVLADDDFWMLAMLIEPAGAFVRTFPVVLRSGAAIRTYYLRLAPGPTLGDTVEIELWSETSQVTYAQLLATFGGTAVSMDATVTVATNPL